MKSPDQLREDLERMIELEWEGTRGNPEWEAKAWLEKLAEMDQERRGHLRLAAKGHMTDGGLVRELAEARRNPQGRRARASDRQEPSGTHRTTETR